MKPDLNTPTLGQKCAEAIARLVGSWKFIIFQTLVLAGWVYLNVIHLLRWDSYPFILMNLFLSLQAAYTAPMILMAQNRQNEKDRQILHDDFLLDGDSNQRLKILEEKLDILITKQLSRGRTKTGKI